MPRKKTKRIIQEKKHPVNVRVNEEIYLEMRADLRHLYGSTFSGWLEQKMLEAHLTKRYFTPPAVRAQMIKEYEEFGEPAIFERPVKGLTDSKDLIPKKKK